MSFTVIIGGKPHQVETVAEARALAGVATRATQPVVQQHPVVRTKPAGRIEIKWQGKSIWCNTIQEARNVRAYLEDQMDAATKVAASALDGINNLDLQLLDIIGA